MTVFFGQRSTVDCRQPSRCGDGFSIPILIRFLVIDYNRLWSVFCQRSAVHCWQPFGCATSFSIQIWIRSIYLRNGLTVVRGPSAVDIFFVNGPQSTVDSRSVVPHRLASILRTWPARRGGYLVQFTVVCRPLAVDKKFYLPK